MVLVLAASALLIDRAALLMDHTSLNRTNDQASLNRTVEANEFILKDANGNERAKLATTENTTALGLRDANGKLQVVLYAHGESSGVVLATNVHDASGARMSVKVTEEGPSLSLRANEAGEVALKVTEEGPSLSVYDPEGFRTQIGSTDLLTPRTGLTGKTSAASVVLFDKDNNVIWRAP